MSSLPRFLRFAPLLFAFQIGLSPSNGADPVKVVLLAGEVQKVDRVGHHDYLGGCRLMQALLTQTPDVQTVLVTHGWPQDESVFEGASTLVFYTDGAGKQAYLETPERIATVQKLVDAGVGIVSIHQAVEYPAENAKQSTAWIGALYNKGFSGRGHWDSEHNTFPDHPITRGVEPWKIKDGWLNGFRFAEGSGTITPLVWSGKEHAGASTGGTRDVVAWAYDRPDGGRSFSFSGLDAHTAWELPGVSKLLLNGILWTAGKEIPQGGAPCEIDKTTIDSFLTPRTPKPAKVK